LELAPPERVSCAAAAGFSHVGVRVLPATTTEPHHDLVGNPALLRELQQRLSDTGVKVLDVEIFRLQPDTRAADFEAALATAAALGASDVLVAGNDPHEARLCDNFAALCDLASR
jgi:sugar phosphate isomerase/epimerase